MTSEDRKSHKRYYAAADLAISKDSKRSYTAICIGGVDDTGVLHIVDVIRQRFDPKEIVDKLIAVQVMYKPELFVLEKGQISLSIGPFLLDEQLKRGVFLNKIEKPPMNDKLARARAIQGRMRQGGVRFDTESEWWPSFQEELLRFDRGEYDDQVDALAWLGQILNELESAPTVLELRDMEWEDEVRETGDGHSSFGLFGGGKSAITGY
jgi:predicted phage terminase large subunit-like protein